MSHKATVKMKIQDKDALLDSLKSMGVEYQVADQENGLRVSSRYGVNNKVDILLLKDGKGKSMKAVGFRKEKDGSYVGEGDFYEVSSCQTKDGEKLNQSNFGKTVSKRYAYTKAVNELTKMGFGVSEDVGNWNENELSFSMQSQY